MSKNEASILNTSQKTKQMTRAGANCI